MTYEVEIQFTGWATKTVTVTAKDADEATAIATTLARETSSDELEWVVDGSPYDLTIDGWLSHHATKEVTA